jgi:hypothetical protein
MPTRPSGLIFDAFVLFEPNLEVLSPPRLSSFFFYQGFIFFLGVYFCLMPFVIEGKSAVLQAPSTGNGYLYLSWTS